MAQVDLSSRPTQSERTFPSDPLELEGAARNETAAVDIVGSSLKEIGPVQELAEAVVASNAKQPANEVLVVVVIEVMALVVAH